MDEKIKDLIRRIFNLEKDNIVQLFDDSIYGKEVIW